MEKKKELYVGTALYKDGPQTRTKLTVDFSGLSDEDILEMATDSAVIKWQASARRAALKKENATPIPTEATYSVPKPGTRATGEVSTERAMQVLLKKAGGDVSKAIEMLQGMVAKA